MIGATASAFGQTGRLTAGQVVDRIKEHLGVPWRGGPTDTFKTGDAQSPVTGIATTVMSTFDVIKRAAAAGRNVVITHGFLLDHQVVCPVAAGVVDVLRERARAQQRRGASCEQRLVHTGHSLQKNGSSHARYRYTALRAAIRYASTASSTFLVRRLLVVHGPNLNLLGTRQPEVYGKTGLAEIDAAIGKVAREKNAEVRTFQSNSEGAIIDALHDARGWADAVIINAGAYTHYSYAIADAVQRSTSCGGGSSLEHICA